MGELTLMVPLDGKVVISSPYGWRTLRSTGKRKFHFGTDYEVPVGRFVRASESGRVIRAAKHIPGDRNSGSRAKDPNGYIGKNLNAEGTLPDMVERAIMDRIDFVPDRDLKRKDSFRLQAWLDGKNLGYVNKY